ncbi:hypothetical protein AB0L41_00985 [Amycolatopsis mediterranei]|uniref:hypothetical protein n=1 Tax=Amycolatopsis mediterranei TaxID=33910 RepID=UPI0034475C8F
MADELVWAQVVRPSMPMVYLDLNHLIYLAKENVSPGSAPNGYKELLTSAVLAASEQRAAFPLSGQHVFEISAIKDPRQRAQIADVVELLSGYAYLLGRPEIARLEIEAGIESVLGEAPDLTLIPLVGSSFGWAFGKIGGMKIVDSEGNDASNVARRNMGADRYESFLRYANYSLERAMLAGPADEEIPDLRSKGYKPEASRIGQESRLAFEKDLSGRLENNPRWRRGRLRDLVSGREIAHEWLDAINEVNDQRVRCGRPSFDPPADAMNRFFAAMPHTQVAISMKTRYHRNPAHKWTTNDIVDIDAMSVAYAYCEAVFTDKAARSALANSKELRVFGTYLPRTPQQLAEWLDGQPRRLAPQILVPHPPNLSSDGG